MKKALLLISCLIISLSGIAQIVHAGADQYLCEPGTVQLNGTGSNNYFYYRWLPQNMVSDSTIFNPTTTTINTTTTFYFRGYYEDLSIVNFGDFEGMGNGPFTNYFTSSYTNNQSSVWSESTYAITSNAHNVHSNFANRYDHTFGTTAGHYMVVNGATNPNATVWQRTVNISPNTRYIFSTWICTLHDDGAQALARLQFSINNQLLGQVFTAPATVADGWQQFYTTWESGNNTSAIIKIVNQNTTGSGNDFGVDDIHFAPLIPDEDSVTIHIYGGSNAYDTVNICYNESFDFMGRELTHTGDYVDTMPTPFGNVMCDSILHLHLIVGDDLSVDLGSDKHFCSNVATEFTLNAGEHFGYEWSTGETTSNITVNETGQYNVTISDEAGCTAKGSIFIEFEETPVVYIVNQTEDFCAGYSADLFAEANAEAFLWNTGENTQTITVHNPGVYTVEARNGDCKTSAAYKIEFCDFRLYFPNAFTPNNDGVNDYFCMSSTEDITGFDIRIYDRWGEIVYQSSNPHFQWDGTSKGKKVSEGIYNYVVNLEISSGRPYVFSGQITVIGNR